MRKGEKIQRHNHSSAQEALKYSQVSGNLFICSDHETKTWYEQEPVINSPGCITLFPSFVNHETDQYMGDEVRISIAFDIKNETDWKVNVYDKAKHHWIKL